ncbi:phage tail length tape measure family protein [Methylobacterium sp. WL6]|uniref:phage tail length tape measure family protein n=1 Tax=Methylobacterium sp. WL6 TaxID=2603901 RepID=UPI0011CBB9A0|nr:phage tail length tape measure family protein [Methylobacterium sp. WL6]TXN71726.1 hypothetical protein FV230_07335 [Methylobacterium sp. WL6]
MPTSINTIRTMTVRYQSEGADKVRSDAAAVTAAQDRMGQSAQAAANVTEQASKRQLSAAAAYQKVRESVDAAARAESQYERVKKTLDRAQGQGVIGAVERAATLEAAQRKYFPQAGGNDNHPAAARGLDSRDKMFVQYSAFSGASSLTAGAGLGSVALQQGVGVVQHLADREGGLKAGLSDLGATAAGLVTPFTVAATAVAALGAGFALAATQAASDQKILETATQGLGRATGATAEALNGIALANAAAGKASTSSAREMVAAFNQTGQISTSVYGTLVQSTSEYARVTGQDAKEATAELARAFSDLSTGADAIAAKLGGLDDKTRQLIATQMEQGDKSGAQATAAEYLKTTIDANATSTTGWAAAWNTATAAANGYWEAAKRIAGIKLGIAPEGAQEAVIRLNSEIDKANNIRGAVGMQPLGLGDSRVTQRDTAALILDTQQREAAARAAEERADRASKVAGNIARTSDPNYARLSELRTQQSQLSEAIADPLARSKLADFGQTETAYLGVTRAIETMVDANGKLVSSEEMTRRGNQLQLDAVNAKTDAEKALVAQRQKAFDLIGKAIPGSDARSQINMAGRLSLANASEKSGGGSKGEEKDEYDRALKSIDDRVRRQQEDAATYGMGAAAVAKYRTETELLTAAKRAERDITPALTSEIQGYAQKAADAAEKQESLRESMKTMDGVRSTGKEVFGGVFNDISRGTTAATTFANAIGKIQSRILDLASTSLTDAIFGKAGTSGSGILGGSGFLSSLFGGGGGASANAPAPGAQGPTLETGGFLGTIGKIFGFANGGIMGPNGQIPLHTYSNGGVANSPQMAIFGEGRMNEAYVPLPDGKRIPVAMAGPANSNSQSRTDARSYNIDLRGSTLTREEVSVALTKALAKNNDERDRTFIERTEYMRRAAG